MLGITSAAEALLIISASVRCFMSSFLHAEQLICEHLFDKTKDVNFKNKIFLFNVNVNYFMFSCSNIICKTMICEGLYYGLDGKLLKEYLLCVLSELCGTYHLPSASRAARNNGSPASTIFCWAAAILYATRMRQYFFVSVSYRP